MWEYLFELSHRLCIFYPDCRGEVCFSDGHSPQPRNLSKKSAFMQDEFPSEDPHYERFKFTLILTRLAWRMWSVFCLCCFDLFSCLSLSVHHGHAGVHVIERDNKFKLWRGKSAFIRLTVGEWVKNFSPPAECVYACMKNRSLWKSTWNIFPLSRFIILCPFCQPLLPQTKTKEGCIRMREDFFCQS